MGTKTETFTVGSTISGPRQLRVFCSVHLAFLGLISGPACDGTPVQFWAFAGLFQAECRRQSNLFGNSNRAQTHFVNRANDYWHGWFSRRAQHNGLRSYFQDQDRPTKRSPKLGRTGPELSPHFPLPHGSGIETTPSGYELRSLFLLLLPQTLILP